VMKMPDDINYKSKMTSDDSPEDQVDTNGGIKEARNYRKEYDNYQGKPEQRANRSKRVLARRKLIKLGKCTVGDGKDVDHRNGNPQDNSDGNLRVRSVHANRSDNKQQQKEEHGAGDEGTKKLLQRYLKDTPYAKIYNLDNAKNKK